MKWIIATLLLLLSLVAYGQVSGTVTDEASNEPLPGATVLIKGTMTGTICDAEGRFTIDAEIGDVLAISYVGYLTAEVELTSTNDISVSLAAATEELNELVVVGYGTQKKSDVTGSVVSIDAEKLEDRPSTNIVQALQGSMAGLRVSVTGSTAEGSSTSMLIRGQNSITADNDPLIIIDGIPYSGRMSEINPNDIQSIEVLKDASSSAIYGARGANGVILISTKKGKAGQMRVSYDGYYSLDQIAYIPDMMDGETFYQSKLDYGETFTVLEQENYDAGKFTDFIEEATRPGSKTQHNLSMSGATDKNRYYISGSYSDIKGVAKNDNFNRYTTRINIEQDLNNWMKLGTNTSLGYYDRSGQKADFYDAFRMNPLGNAYNDDGTIALLAWEDPQYAVNPLNALNIVDSDISRRINTNNYLQMDFPFLEGLSYRLNTGIEFISKLHQTYAGRDTYTGYQTSGELRIFNSYEQNWIVENILSYAKTFGVHSLFLTALYSAQQEQFQSNWIEGINFPSDVLTFFQPDKAASSQSYSSYEDQSHLSQMFRANYSYDSKYLVTFTVRRDGFSAFGQDRKFGIFPSFAVGWNINNEDFFKSAVDNRTINRLKLRVSYGVNGNEAITPYSTLPYLSSKDYLTADYRPAFGFYPEKLGNPTLGWETTRSFNTGIDFGILSNRITGLVDLYWSRTTDLLLDKTISPMNGDIYIRSNIGETKNQGIEFQISSVNISRSKFTWRTDFNIARNRTSIVNVGLTDENGNYIDDIASRWFIGEPINVNYDYIFDGIWQEEDDIASGTQPTAHPGDIKYKDLDGNSEINADDKAIIGSRIPTFVAGMSNTLKYGNFSLSFLLNSVYGITRPNYLLGTGDISFRIRPYNKDYWTVENPNNEYPANVDRDVNPYDMNFYMDASFIRLQDITLAYKMPARLTQNIYMQNLEFYINLKNMATWTNWTGLDPEFLTSSQQRATPQLKSYLFGIKLSF
ncbi:MAG: TonB-dependent receptor [Bacteroidales bacterium]|nr:TonB-dependent receptor [Bacteroidales bacterium]MDT8432384.1 TonB-dependent receptor [Bacteroidales bacterium]